MERFQSALDPELENSVDIQALLNNSCEVTDETWEKLIMDIKTSDMEKVTENTTDIVPVKGNVVDQGHDSLMYLSEFDFFANSEQISSCLGAVRETLHPQEDDNGVRRRDDIHDVDMESSFSSTSEDSSPSSFIVTPPPSPHDAPALMLRPRGRPGRKPLSPNGPIKKKKQPPKGTAEYYDKRARNNLAIKKCREKAKQKQIETETRLLALETENSELKLKNDKLNKKMDMLKLFVSKNDVSLPDNIYKLLVS